MLVLSLLAGAAAAQEDSPQGLVFHVAAVRGEAPKVSLGIVHRTAAGIALQSRREMQADCSWAQAPDLPVEADSLVPLRDPAGLGGAAGFGDYYATLFNALATAKGAASSPAQRVCIQGTMTALGASLLRRAGREGPSAGPRQ